MNDISTCFGSHVLSHIYFPFTYAGFRPVLFEHLGLKLFLFEYAGCSSILSMI